MQAVTHYFFGPYRRRTDIETLSPPLRWRDDQKIDDVQQVRPVGRDEIYLFRSDGSIERRSALDGEVIWRQSLPGLEGSFFTGNLVVGAHAVYVSTKEHIYRLERQQGHIAHQRSFDPASELGLLLWTKGSFVVYDFNTAKPSRLLLVDPRSLQTRWSRTTDGPTGRRSCLTEDQRRVVTTEERDTITCLRLSDGEELWSHTLADLDLEGRLGLDAEPGEAASRIARLACYHDTILMASSGSITAGLSAEDGSVTWCRDLAQLEGDHRIGSSDAFLVEHDGTVTFYHTRLFARFDVRTGEMQQLVPVRGERVPMISYLDASKDYYWTASRRLPAVYALDKESGECAWQHRLALKGVSGITHPMICDGRLYVVDKDSRLFIFEEQTR